VVLAGLHGEGGGHRDHLGAFLRQRLEQVGKTQVVADRATDGDPLAVVGDDRIARLDRRAFPIGGSVRGRHVEEVNLAVAGDLGAIAVEDDRRVVDPILAVNPLHDRAGVDENAMFDRLGARHRIGRAARQRLRIGELVGPRTARPVELFRQQHPVGRLFGDGALDQRLGRSDIGGLVADRVHLDERDFHRRRLPVGVPQCGLSAVARQRRTKAAKALSWSAMKPRVAGSTSSPVAASTLLWTKGMMTSGLLRRRPSR
jgi:hypothetical protein